MKGQAPIVAVHCKWGSYPPCLVRAPLELGTYYHYTPTSHTRDTVRRVDHFITISPSRTLVLPDSCDFRLCEGGILWDEQSFMVKEGPKKGLKKERRPIAKRQLLYQSSLLPHFLSHGATVIVHITDQLFRLCGDYKMIMNKCTNLDSYPIPKIEDLQTKLSQRRKFIKLDLRCVIPTSPAIIRL